MNAMKNASHILLLLLSATCSGALSAAQSSGFPARPIRMLVGFAPGGGIDAAMRPLLPKLSENLGQQVIIDNRAGAGGNIASELAAKAEPNGYSLLAIVPAFAINASLQPNLPFNATTDFTGVTQIGETVNIISLHPSVPANSVKELIALAKAKPLNFGSSGVGTIGHLAGELFNVMAGTHITHVPYKGGGPVMTDLLGGQINIIFASPGTVLAPIKAGRIKAIAVTTAKRTPLLPDLPTVAESGLPGYEAKNWYGLLAPARTPAAVIQRLNTEVRRALAVPEVHQAVLNQGIDPVTSSAAEFTSFVRGEVAKWSKVVKAAGIKPE